jgi:hypothetical protein
MPSECDVPHGEAVARWFELNVPVRRRLQRANEVRAGGVFRLGGPQRIENHILGGLESAAAEALLN